MKNLHINKTEGNKSYAKYKAKGFHGKSFKDVCHFWRICLLN